MTLDAVGFPALELVVSGPVDEPVVAIAGELDVATVDQARTCFSGCVAQGARRIVVDCARLSFISAAGLALFAETAAALEAHDGEVIVRHPSRFVVRLLEITGLDAKVRVEHPREAI